MVFERFTEAARRVIFFARYEAAQLRSDYIDTPHLLLGLLREDSIVMEILERHGIEPDGLRRKLIGGEHGEPVSQSVDIALSEAAQRALAHAQDEADQQKSGHVGTEHLLIGILLESGGGVLREAGITADSARSLGSIGAGSATACPIGAAEPSASTWRVETSAGRSTSSPTATWRSWYSQAPRWRRAKRPCAACSNKLPL